jgi:hypothetical protein
MRSFPMFTTSCLALTLVLAGAGCGDDDDGGGNENEVITTVSLVFTPVAGGAPITVEFDDPDGDGGDPPTIDPVALAPGMYTVAVGFENRLENPPEIITEEVADESDVHQIFFTGTAVNGPASDQADAPLTHAYADTDANGLPIGLADSITAALGTGELTVTLRHMPPVNDVAVKSADVAAQVKAGGFAAIGGSTDAQVTFPVTVE